jgi:Dolichyl-phosphate-mannose-protein mannosyltransferase
VQSHRSSSLRRAGSGRPLVSLRYVAFPRARLVLGEVALLVALLGAAAVAFGRSLRADAVYDEGVYLASVDALAHGQKLGSDVFASQPPGFYVLLEAERVVFGGSLVAMRVAMLALALVGCLCAYSIGRCVAGRLGGVMALALLAVPLAVEDEAVRVRADFPSVALSLLAIALTLFAVRRTGVLASAAAILAGAALAAAVSVKLLAVTAVVPVLAIMLRDRRRLVLELAAGTAAVVASLVVAYAGVLGPLWNDAVRFHLRAESAQIAGAPTDLAGNLAKIVNTVSDAHGLRSPFLWLVAVGAVGTLAGWRRRWLLEAAPLWLWVVVSAAFLAWHRPLWAHDVVMLTAALAARLGSRSRRASGRASTGPAGARRRVRPRDRGEHRAPHAENPRPRELRRRVGGERASRADACRQRGRERPADHPGPGRSSAARRADRHLGYAPRERLAHDDEDHRRDVRDRLSAVVIGHALASKPQVVRAVRRRFPFSVERGGVSLPGEKPTTVRLYLRSRS